MTNINNYKSTESGTFYHKETAPHIMDILERVRYRGERIRVHYGDVETGEDWMEDCDVTGTIGRSTGPIKVPLLIHNITSHGGAAMLDHCIVRIRPANKKDGGDIYRHPSYHTS